MREQEGWAAERLAPLLVALLELLRWVRQYFEVFIDDEARALSLTRESLAGWAPPAAARGRGRREKAT